MSTMFFEHVNLADTVRSVGIKVAPMFAMKWGGIALTGFGLFLASWGISSDAESLGSRYWVRYTSHLDRSLRAMFIFTPGRKIASYQLLVAVLFTAFALLAGNQGFYFFAAGALFGPHYWIKAKQKKRVETAEEQLPGFLQIFANALRASPNIGSALHSIVGSLEAPLKDEVALALKELKVGAPLDQALLHIATRLKSRPIDSAISAILIGRQVGGDLPKILDTTAHSLREIFRLEGVVKSKTADAKNQLIMLSLMPPVLVMFFSTMMPGFFDPLTQDIKGYLIAVGAAVAWVIALVWARKILAVDV